MDRPIGIFNKGKKSACVKKGSMEGTTYPHLAFSEDTFFSRLKSPRANQEKLHENRDTIFRLQEESVMMGKISPIHYSKITKLETSPIYPDRNVNFPDHVALKNISDNRSPVFLKADNYQKSPNPFLDTQPEFSIAPPKTQLSKIKFTGHYRELVQEYTATEESFPTMTNLKETLKNSAGLQIDTISGSKSTSSISTSSHSSFSAETFINFKDQYEKRVEEKTLERMKEMWRPRKLY